VVDWAVPRSEKKNNSSVVLKVKEEPEEDSASIKTEKSDPEEKSRYVKTEGKCKVLSTQVVQNGETKECKKNKNSKKGRLIVRNLPFKVSKNNQFLSLAVRVYIYCRFQLCHSCDCCLRVECGKKRMMSTDTH